MRAIVLETKELCRKEKELEAQIIRNLIEIFNQKIYLEMGYSGLHNFCVGELGLSHTSAQRKVEVVRMIKLQMDIGLYNYLLKLV